MLGTIGALVAGSLASGVIGAASSNKAVKAQTQAADKSSATQRYIFDKSVALTEPQRQIGTNAMNALASMYGLAKAPKGFTGFQADPAYQFRLGQGNQAMDRAASARGMRMGGATMKAASDYNQGMASQEYGNYLSRLGTLAGYGQQATGQQISAGQNYGANVSNNLMAAGQARASGYAGQNDAFQGTMNNLFQIYGMNKAGMF